MHQNSQAKKTEEEWKDIVGILSSLTSTLRTIPSLFPHKAAESLSLGKSGDACAESRGFQCYDHCDA